jgi:GIY-YIG catalytic domain
MRGPVLPTPSHMAKAGVAPDVTAIRAEIRRFLDTLDSAGRKIGNAKFGVYAFYDYDGEPIYVGQTEEMLRSRIARHLTNQRTDAVAMNVLDPFEVAEIEVWPLYPEEIKGDIGTTLNAIEYTVFQKVLKESQLGAVLNEKDIPKTRLVKLPRSYRSRIIPDGLYELRKHPDTRIARRASTIANLARVISERNVSKGLRRTLLTQARRLERLAARRLADFTEEYPVEDKGEETGEKAAE